MNPNLFSYYQLHLKQINKNGKVKIVIDKIIDLLEDNNKFVYPTNNKRAKLYVVKHKNKIIYVGITAQPIINRFRSGLNPNTKFGYHGYAWKHLKKVEVLIWCDWGKGKATKDDLKIFETIEGEIVYIARDKMGKWPEYQTEIHFHNGSESEKKIAQRIWIIAKSKR